MQPGLPVHDLHAGYLHSSRVEKFNQTHDQGHTASLQAYSVLQRTLIDAEEKRAILLSRRTLSSAKRWILISGLGGSLLLEIISAGHTEHLCPSLPCRCCNSTHKLVHCSMENHGMFLPYSSPGCFMGTGTTPSNTARLFSSVVKSRSGFVLVWRARMGIITPHSQLRQMNFGFLVTASLANIPQALSERFAEPTYAHAVELDGCGSEVDPRRTNQSLMSFISQETSCLPSRPLTNLAMHQQPTPTALAVA